MRENGFDQSVADGRYGLPRSGATMSLLLWGSFVYQGFPDAADLQRWFGGMLVLDDLMEEAGNDKRVLDLFTKESHHRGITVLYLCQDLFPPGRFAKPGLRTSFPSIQ